MKRLTHIATTALFGLTLLAAGCAQVPQQESAEQSSDIAIHNAWVRAVPPTSRMSAAYMMLHNASEADDHLLSAETDVAKKVELHNVRQKGEMMEMYQVKSIGVPAGGMRELKPGSYHVMLIGLKQPLKAGDEVELTMNFMHAGSIKVTAPVKEGGMAMKHMQH